MPEIVLNFAVAISAIMNPIGKIPVWNQLTGDKDKKVKIFIAFFICITATLILALFLFFGSNILQFFDVDFASFRVAGGLFSMFVAFQMPNGGNEFNIDKDDTADDSIIEDVNKLKQSISEKIKGVLNANQ